jgi:hypothetical protein
VPGNGIDENCDGRDAAFPPVSTEFRLRFDTDAKKRGTTFKVFELRHVPAGATVSVTCKSKKFPGCVFKTRSQLLRVQRAKLSVRGYFGDRPLSKGTVVQARVSVPRALGRLLTITMGKPGSPKRGDGCLAANSTTQVPCP